MSSHVLVTFFHHVSAAWCAGILWLSSGSCSPIETAVTAWNPSFKVWNKGKDSEKLQEALHFEDFGLPPLLLFTPFRWSFQSFLSSSVVTRGRTLPWAQPFCSRFSFHVSAFFLPKTTVFFPFQLLWWVWCRGLLERPCSTLEATSLPYSRLIPTNVLHRLGMCQQTRDLSACFGSCKVVSSRLVRWRVLSSTWWGAPGRMQFLGICRRKLHR